MKVVNQVVIPNARAFADRLSSLTEEEVSNSYARVLNRKGKMITLDRPLMGDHKWEISDLHVLCESISDFDDHQLISILDGMNKPCDIDK